VNIPEALIAMAADGLRMVRCPACRKLWICGPEDRPTKRGLCTCKSCREAPPEHTGNHGKQKARLSEDSPAWENGIRAMEDRQ
jgi:hypothetical protein